jgi:glucosylceramidase
MPKLLILILFQLFIFPVKGQPVKRVTNWISSSPENKWEQRGDASLTEPENISNYDFEVFTESYEQKIDGFGGCFNELGWEALKALKPLERENIIRALFDSIDGCRFSICRLPLGANDYAVDWYSLDEEKNDFKMKHFTLERDRQRLIPYIKSAQKYRPDLLIWASPWCPPSWMKMNNHYACRSDLKYNDLPIDKQGKEMKTQFRMEPKYLKSYAVYFRKFVEGYRKEGIPIYAVHVQNEMNSCQPFPSCVWEPQDLNTFIGRYLGPELKNTGTELWLGTVERPQFERVKGILLDSRSSRYIKGVSFQWAGKGVIAAVHDSFPSLKLMQSETECGNGSNDWRAAEHTFNLLCHYLNHGASAYMYWNMVLNDTGKSQWGWRQNSMISISQLSGSVTFNPEFYLMKQLSRAVLPGFYKIKSKGDFHENVCFITKGKLVLLMNNKEDVPKEISIRIKESLLKVTLKAHSFNTIELEIN